jgi:hypothetical protein
MGMLDDWKITFAMSTLGSNSTSLVKYISIQFPNTTTSDIQLLSRSCIGFPGSSNIEVANCVIDINSRVIWVTPVVKSTYTDAYYLVIETVGLAIRNAINYQTNLNQFTIRYYTWPNGQSNPGIVAGSDNWCFMKQMTPNIPSSPMTKSSYSTTYYPQHTYLYSPP